MQLCGVNNMPAFTAYFLGSDQAYHAPPDQNAGLSPDKSKEKTQLAEEEANINTRFYDATDNNKVIYDGPTGLRDVDKIETNIQEAIAAISTWLNTTAPDPDGKYHINLTGFSRGAVTCLRLAHRLHAMIKDKQLKDSDGNAITITANQIAINIYADDPVAGLFDKKDIDAREIPPIVKNYIATLQIDERSKFFAPQDLSRIRIIDSEETNVTFLPLYGDHSKTNKIKMKETKELTEIHWNLKYAFLSRHGTTFKNNNMPGFAYSNEVESLENSSKVNTETHFGLLEKYAVAKQNRDLYKTTNKKPNESLKKSIKKLLKKALTKPRSFTDTYRDDYTIDPFFLNQHEKELFKICYPKVFNYLFEKARLDPADPANTGGIKTPKKSSVGYTKEDIDTEFTHMGMRNPELLKNLVTAGKVVKENKEYKLIDSPSGVSQIERCRLINMLEGHPIPNKSPLELIKEKLMFAVYRLHPEKNADQSGLSKEEYDHGLTIKPQMYEILDSSDTDQVKLENVITLLKTSKQNSKFKLLNKSLDEIILYAEKISFEETQKNQIHSDKPDLSNPLSVADQFKLMKEKIGHYDIENNGVIESPEKSRERVQKLLKQGSDLLYKDTAPNETTTAREKLLALLETVFTDKTKNFIAKKNKKFYQKDLKNAAITLHNLLGKDGLKLYKEAVLEEKMSKAYRDALFLKSIHQIPSEGKWKKNEIIWIAGPAGIGKSFVTETILNKLAKEKEKEKQIFQGSREQEIAIIADGEKDREVCQIRSLTLKIALEKGYSGIFDLYEQTNLEVKNHVLDAAFENQINIVIPETFAQRLNPARILSTKLDSVKKMEEFQKKIDEQNLPYHQTFVDIRGESAKNVSPEEARIRQNRFANVNRRQGKTRPWADIFDEEHNKSLGKPIKINNRDIKAKSKAYDPGWFFFEHKRLAGIYGSKVGRDAYKKIIKKDPCVLAIIIDRMFVGLVTDKNNNKKIQEVNDEFEGKVIALTVRAFNKWKDINKSNQNKLNNMDELKEWLQSEEAKRLSAPIIENTTPASPQTVVNQVLFNYVNENVKTFTNDNDKTARDVLKDLGIYEGNKKPPTFKLLNSSTDFELPKKINEILTPTKMATSHSEQLPLDMAYKLTDEELEAKYEIINTAAAISGELLKTNATKPDRRNSYEITIKHDKSSSIAECLEQYSIDTKNTNTRHYEINSTKLPDSVQRHEFLAKYFPEKFQKLFKENSKKLYQLDTFDKMRDFLSGKIKPAEVDNAAKKMFEVYQYHCLQKAGNTVIPHDDYLIYADRQIQLFLKKAGAKKTIKIQNGYDPLLAQTFILLCEAKNLKYDTSKLDATFHKPSAAEINLIRKKMGIPNKAGQVIVSKVIDVKLEENIVHSVGFFKNTSKKAPAEYKSVFDLMTKIDQGVNLKDSDREVAKKLLQTPINHLKKP